MLPTPAEPPLLAPVRWSLLHTGLIWIYRGTVSRFGKGFRPGRHSLAAWLFLRGSGWVEAHGRRTRARTGQWLMVHPSEREQHFSDDAEILSIRFAAEWPDGACLYEEGLSVALDASAYPDLQRKAEALEKTARHILLPGETSPIDLPTHLRIERKFLDWLQAFHEAMLRKGLRPSLLDIEDARLRQALLILRRWPLETAYREARLADDLGMSRQQLETLFVRSLGITSKKFLDRRKLAHAKERLGLGKESIKEIGYQIGFRHSSSFCNWFRKRTGFYPALMAKQSVRF